MKLLNKLFKVSVEMNDEKAQYFQTGVGQGVIDKFKEKIDDGLLTQSRKVICYIVLMLSRGDMHDSGLDCSFVIFFHEASNVIINDSNLF